MLSELHSNDFRLLGILNRKITSRYLHDSSAPQKCTSSPWRRQTAFERHDFALAYRFMTRLLLRHRGFEINEATEVATALDFKLDRRLLVPGDPLTITLEPILELESPPRHKFTATFVLRDRAGRMEEALPSIAVQEMRIYRVPVDTSMLAAGRHSIIYKLHGPDGRSLVECPRDFVVDPDARQRLQVLEDGFGRLGTKSEQPIAVTSARETIEFVLIQMRRALDSYHAAMNHKSFPMTVKLRGVDMARYDNDPFESARDLPLVESLMADLEGGRDPFSARTGDMRLAFRSQLDGELQPFRVFVPETRQRARMFPAVIALHGATGDENTYFDRYLEVKTAQNLFKKLGQEFGFLLAAPNGRGPFGMYTENSERDVLEMLDRLQSLFPVDPREVFLTGHSMGGMGTWSLGFRYANRFAALAPVAGRPADSVIPFLDQAPEKPVLFVAGLNDVIVTPAKTSEWAQIARRHLRHFEYREYPRDDHFSIGLSSMPAIFEFFEGQRKGKECSDQEDPDNDL